MIVTDKHTGEKLNVPEAYGLRLIEQGKAIPAAQEEKKPAKDAKEKKGGKIAGDA